MSVVRDVWFGDGVASRASRVLLTPASWVVGAIAAQRSGTRHSTEQRTAIPVLSVGNLTVGGTGKTPLAAWAAAELRARGARPAIVMRGYGDDERHVHARLNPDVPVIVNPDRVQGVASAHAGGADCAVLDDGFQHHRVARVSNWVLIAAEQWRDDLRVLPAGPLREPVEAIARATATIITRKSVSATDADLLAGKLSAQFPGLSIAVCHLSADSLIDPRTDVRRPLDSLMGQSVAVATGIGEPDAFLAQLRAMGARPHVRIFRDHHPFSPTDVKELADLAARYDGLVCTLKDAVKLAPLWPPAAAPLWYVSQNVVIERGESVLDHEFATVLAARQGVTSTAGSIDPRSSPHGHRSTTAD